MTRLTEAGANVGERAILLEQGGAMSDFVYERLTRAGVLVFAGNDRYYLNQQAYDAFRGRRRRRAIIVSTVMAVIFVVLYFFGVIS